MLKSWYMVFFQVHVYLFHHQQRAIGIRLSRLSYFSVQFFPSFWQCPKTLLSSTHCSKMQSCLTTRRLDLESILWMVKMNMMPGRVNQWSVTTRRLDFEDFKKWWWGWCHARESDLRIMRILRIGSTLSSGGGVYKFPFRIFSKAPSQIPNTSSQIPDRSSPHQMPRSNIMPNQGGGSIQVCIQRLCHLEQSNQLLQVSSPIFFHKQSFYWSWAFSFHCLQVRCFKSSSSASSSAWSIMISIIIIRTIIMATTTTKFNSLIVFRCAASKESRQWVDKGVGKKLKMIQVFLQSLVL